MTDAVAFYEAVVRAKPGGLGRVEALDVQKPDSIHEILRREMNLFQIFKLAANRRNSICSEWITDYEITFGLGYPYFERQLSKTGNLNEATVNTYLRVLSKMPDTLIARKAGPQRARWVSKRAREALDLGGASSSAGLKEIHRLDEDLIANRQLLNPAERRHNCRRFKRRSPVWI